MNRTKKGEIMADKPKIQKLEWRPTMAIEDVVSVLQAIMEMTEDKTRPPAAVLVGIRNSISLAIGKSVPPDVLIG